MNTLVNCVAALAVVCFVSVEAGYDRYCPHRIKGPYDGLCYPVLLPSIKKLCDLHKAGEISPSATSALMAGDNLPAILRTMVSSSKISSNDLLNSRKVKDALSRINDDSDYFDVESEQTAMMHSLALRKHLPLIQKSVATSMVRSRRQLPVWFPKNIICECCYHICTVKEALEYCW